MKRDWLIPCEIATAFNIKHVSGVTHQVRQLKLLIDEERRACGLYQLAIQNLTL